MPTRTNSSSSSYETGLYSNLIRPSGTSQSSGPSGSGGGGGTGGGGGGDLFVAYLDAEEQTRHQSQSSQGSGFPLDWPVHSTSGGGDGSTQSSRNLGGSGGSGPSTSSSGGF